MLRVFNTILYENEFQNTKNFQQTISLSPGHSTLERYSQKLRLSKKSKNSIFANFSKLMGFFAPWHLTTHKDGRPIFGMLYMTIYKFPS
jgi:hypothetical protein